MMKISEFSIGMTAAIVTSMGLIAGLAQGGGTKADIIAGLLIFAIADNISDSLGIHIYKESEGASRQEITLITLGNFIIRLLLALTFVLIIFLLDPHQAFIFASIWGLILLTILSYGIARIKQSHPMKEIVYHLIIAIMVIIGSRFIGSFISSHITGG
jgi:vacuolar iron transporter family protein